MKVLRLVAACCAGAMLAACGGSDTSPSSDRSSTTTTNGCAASHGTMSAVINGAAWTATCVSQASAIGTVISIGATDGNQTLGFSISANGLGAYSMSPIDPLNPPQTLRLATALVTLLPATNSASWTASAATPNSSGTLTLTGLTSTGVAGTFSFTAVATPGTPASGTKVVSNGVMNITF